MRRLVLFAAVLALPLSIAVGAQAPVVELKVGDMAPDFSLQASDGKTYKLSDFRGKKAVVVAWFPKAIDARLHDRVQVARGERPPAEELPDDLLHGQRRSARGQRRVRQGDVGEARRRRWWRRRKPTSRS